MSEFEKYWMKLEASGDLDYFATPKEAGEAVWKAAIGWANTKCRAHVTIHNNVYSDINAELMKLGE